MTTQLEIYQQALLALGEVPVASLAENSEARRLCDFAWNAGFVNSCLEQGLWKFAVRSVAISYDTLSDPPFGYKRAFTLPDDFIRTVRLSVDERENTPITAYTEEAGFIYSDLDVMYLRYISNDVAYGGNLTIWPESFNQWAILVMAIKVGPKLTASQAKMTEMKKDANRLLANAKSKSAMEGPTQFPPMGSWAASRGRNSVRLDRGSRTSLFG